MSEAAEPPVASPGATGPGRLRGVPARTPWSGAVLGLAFLLTPAIAYGGPLGFAILPAVAALLLLPLWVRRRRPHPILLILVALWVWAAASYAWSPAAPAGADRYGELETLTGLKLLFVLATGGVFAAAAGQLSGPAARRALWAMAFVFTAYAAVVAVESVSGAPMYAFFTRTFAEPVRPDIALVHLGQGTVALALLAWPLVLSLRPLRAGGLLSAVILLGGLVASVVLDQQSAALALVAGGVVFALSARFGPLAIRLLGGLAAGGVLAAPWLVLALDRVGALAGLKAMAPASTDARLDIWRLVSERVAQQPLRGWGLDASRLLPPPVSLHPHDGPLQVWFELGAHGAILVALVWWAVFDLCARAAEADRPSGAAAAAAATAYFIIGALSFGVWQEWWLGLGARSVAVFAAVLVQRRWESQARPAAGPRQAALRPI